MNKIYELTPEELKMRIMENQIKQTDEYAISNRGFITASKLKVFRESSENFFLKYIMEEPGKVAEKKCFTIGTAVDDYISYGEEKFNEKYFIPKGKMLKADWVDYCIDKEIGEQSEPLLYDDLLAKYNKMKVDDLKAIATAGKIILSDTDVKNIFGMINEFKRQPIFDYNGGYETQKEFLFDYKGLKLRAKLDRFKENIEGKDIGYIRDMKTTSKIEKFNFSAIDFGYDLSMSFYNILGTLIYKKNFDLILDVISSSFPFASQSIKMPAETVVEQGKQHIIPKLNELAAIMEEWEKTYNPKVWLGEVKGEMFREQLFNCEMYSEMETTIQKEFTILQ